MQQQQKKAAFSLGRGGDLTEIYMRKFENLKTQRCGVGAGVGAASRQSGFPRVPIGPSQCLHLSACSVDHVITHKKRKTVR